MESFDRGQNVRWMVMSIALIFLARWWPLSIVIVQILSIYTLVDPWGQYDTSTLSRILTLGSVLILILVTSLVIGLDGGLVSVWMMGPIPSP